MDPVVLNVLAARSRDIETVQSQLAKPIPNRGIISTAWSTIKGAAVIAECIPLIERIQHFIRR
jgi:hypothetical protein